MNNILVHEMQTSITSPSLSGCCASSEPVDVVVRLIFAEEASSAFKSLSTVCPSAGRWVSDLSMQSSVVSNLETKPAKISSRFVKEIIRPTLFHAFAGGVLRWTSEAR